MAAPPPFNVDVSLCMETSGPPEGVQERKVFAAGGPAAHPPMSRMHCTTNIFSQRVQESVVAHWEAQGNVQEFEIETGGGYLNPAFGQPGEPERLRWSNLVVPLTRLPNQWSCRANSAEWAEASAFYAQRRTEPQPGDPPPEDWPRTYQQCRINPSHLAACQRHAPRASHGGAVASR